MAQIRIGNNSWAFGNDTLLGYSTNDNKVQPINFDSKRYCGKYRMNSKRFLEQVPNDTPTICYEMNEQGALRHENTITIRNPHSEKFGTSYGFSIVGCSANFVDGQNSPMDDLRERSDLNENREMIVSRLQNVTGTNSYIQFTEYMNTQRYVVSCFFKEDSGRYVGFDFGLPNEDNSNIGRVVFDFRTESFVFNRRRNTDANTPDNGRLVEPKAIKYANGWYRIFANFAAPTSTTGVIRIKAYNDSNGNFTDPSRSVFITGLNVSRTSTSIDQAHYKSYIKTFGYTQSNSQDVLTRVNNVQYMLPNFASDIRNGMTWTIKFSANELKNGRYISFNETGASLNNGQGDFYLAANVYEYQSKKYDLQFLFNFGMGNIGSAGIVTNTITSSTLQTGREYHVGITFQDGFLRFSVNGRDANITINNASPSNNNTIFAPQFGGSHSVNDLRLCQPNTSANIAPFDIIDMAAYDRPMTQSELNLLTLQ